MTQNFHHGQSGHFTFQGRVCQQLERDNWRSCRLPSNTQTDESHLCAMCVATSASKRQTLRSRSRSRSLVPKRAPNRRGSILHSEAALPVAWCLRIPRAPSAVPRCPRLAVRPPVCTRPSPSRPVRILLMPTNTQTGQTLHAARSSLKPAIVSPRGGAVTSPRLTTSTTRATHDCCCAPTPSSRPRCCTGSRSLMGSRSLCRVASLSTSGPLCSTTTPHWSSRAWTLLADSSGLRLQAPARVPSTVSTT